LRIYQAFHAQTNQSLYGNGKPGRTTDPISVVGYNTLGHRSST
jgi:hypothetical protein